MNAIGKIRYLFGRYDRITINGDTYRYVGFQFDKHEFQRVTEDVNEQVLEDDCISYTDEEIHHLARRKLFRQEEAYYSKALTELRMRQDTTDLSGLDEEDVRTLFWKREWCVRFNRARAGLDGYPVRLTLTHDDLERFIDLTKDDMARWYFRRYGDHRRPGRPVMVRQPDGTMVKERKPHDYPGPTALKNWLAIYRKADQRVEAFIDRFDKCGRHDQLHPEVDAIVTRCAKGFAALNRPTRAHIYEDIEVELRKLNAARGPGHALKVSDRTVRRRIRKLNPFLVEAGRLGIDAAIRNFGPSGRGVEAEDFLDRVEIDDWTVDLFALICKTSHWRRMTKKQRAMVPRVRATVTVAIDCATRCIVGLNIAETGPTTAGSKAALRSILNDKDGLAALSGSNSGWPMQGRPRLVVTDGGPVFQDEFERAVLQCRSERTLPDRDPRMRGYVESVNRTLKAFCRYFTGQSFASVVELGDYKAEKMASLDFETFRKAFLLFVVGKYHRREHRGLAGMTPYTKWEELTGGRRELPMEDARQLRIFGLKENGVTLGPEGVVNCIVSYWSAEMGVLHSLMGDKSKVDLIVDPSNVGRVLVAVPREYREKHLALTVGHDFERNPQSTPEYLMVPSVDTSLHGKSLVEFAEERADIRAAVEAAREKDQAFRLHAHEMLTGMARRAAIAIGIEDHQISQQRWNTLMRYYRQKSIAASPEYDPDQNAGEAVDGAADDGEGFGTTVATGRPTGTRPRGRAPRNDVAAATAASSASSKTSRADPPPANDPGSDADDFDIPDINDIAGGRE